VHRPGYGGSRVSWARRRTWRRHPTNRWNRGRGSGRNHLPERCWRQGRTSNSTLDELAAALEEVGGVIDQFAPALEHVLARVGDILAGRFDGFPALLGFIGNQLARILAALRGVKDR